ncbi:hypothetical protein VTL71DRAFT_9920, partial [Oculimacula yallundae]
MQFGAVTVQCSAGNFLSALAKFEDSCDPVKGESARTSTGTACWETFQILKEGFLSSNPLFYFYLQVDIDIDINTNEARAEDRNGNTGTAYQESSGNDMDGSEQHSSS